MNLPPLENIILRALQKKGVSFLSIVTLKGPDILRFIAPPPFKEFYLDEQLYNDDPTLTVPQATIGFYDWEGFIRGEKILSFIKNEFHAERCDSLVLCEGKMRMILTTGSPHNFDLSTWFFNNAPKLDEFLSEPKKLVSVNPSSYDTHLT